MITRQQQSAIDKFSKLKVGALFMAMGTGKTLTALTLAQNKVNENKVDYIIYIAPLRTKNNFFKEVEKQGFENLTIYFFGAESFSNSDRIYLEALNLANARVMCIVDESIKIKNDSKRTERIIEIGSRCIYKLILNGTPISKNYFDLYYQMFFLSPKILKVSPEEFKRVFTDRIQIIKKREVVKETIIANKNAEALFKLIEPYTFECKLDSDVNSSEKEIEYSLSIAEENIYYEYKMKLLQDIEMGAFNFLKIVVKMQHAYCCSVEKINKIKKIVDKDTIIFCKFIDSQNFVKLHFPESLVLSYQKHSLGLNLQKYNKCIFWDLTWDYATVEQAKARIMRKGQDKDCEFYVLKSNTSLDFLIENNIKKKITDIVSFKNKFIKELQNEKRI